jgi:hypothetical protein
MAVLPTGIGPVTGYNVERSLRFNSADSAHLSRSAYSVASAGTQWTLSMWVKRSALNQDDLFTFVATTGAAQQAGIQFDANNNIRWWQYAPSTYQFQKITTAVFRDVSAWYHLVFYYDTTLATAEDRLQIWVNGVRQTAFSTNTNPSQNLVTYYKTGQLYPYIGAENRNNAYLGGTGLDGYMTEVNFVDGQALTPSSFGETDTNTGVWKPKAYTGTYGTNGFFLKFADNSNTTAATLGKDSSGNGNNWTPNNFSVTAGAGNDSLVDSPTSYGTDTGVGGTVRGNYATLNPLRPTSSGGFSNGNLTGTAETGAQQGLCSTITLPWSGKWYAEVTFASQINNWCGVTSVDKLAADINTVGQMSVLYYALNGNKYVNGTATAYGASYTTETIGIAFDGLAGTVTFYKANVSQGAITLPSLTVNYVFCQANAAGSAISADWNFGQRAFAYTAPSGFKALCTQNLPTPTIGATSTTQANDYMNIALWTGDASSTRAITGVGHAPDFVWIKKRTAGSSVNRDHVLYDRLRGVGNNLRSSSTNAESTGNTDELKSFDSDGFTLGGGDNVNGSSAAPYVGWAWKANGSGVSNTSGTITSTVSANTTSGFSIVTYTGNGSTSPYPTVGHGLGITPKIYLVKRRGDIGNWVFWHTIVDNSLDFMYLNTTAANANSAIGTVPTSTVMTVGGADANASGSTYVAYCFAPVAGYSAFGIYTGNGSADGPFVYTGFRPRYLLTKESSASGQEWFIWDTARDTYNQMQNEIFPNSSAAENATSWTNQPFIDFTSNGFKLRSINTHINNSGSTFIYAAFAEHPFKYSLAR